jgi:hypothetical protein
MMKRDADRFVKGMNQSRKHYNRILYLKKIPNIKRRGFLVIS